jgi:hypothetical protein
MSNHHERIFSAPEARDPEPPRPQFNITDDDGALTPSMRYLNERSASLHGLERESFLAVRILYS